MGEMLMKLAVSNSYGVRVTSYLSGWLIMFVKIPEVELLKMDMSEGGNMVDIVGVMVMMIVIMMRGELIFSKT